jgi:hypothetical protein
MKRSLLAVAVLALFAAPTWAAPGFNPNAQLNKKECSPLAGNRPIIDVNEKVVNDADSGLAGNYWAFDTYTRHIQVWEQVDGNFCAVVDFNGAKFNAVAGQESPGETGILTGNEDGTFDGGYRAVINGSLLATPTWKVKGNVGTFDYQCDLNGNCPGYVSWIDQYFEPTFGFTYSWWGWAYKGAHNHLWINSSDGTNGDVL